VLPRKSFGRRLAVRAVIAWRAARWRRIERSLEEAARAREPDSAALRLRRASLDVATGLGRLRGRHARGRLPEVVILQRSQFTDDARMLVEELGHHRALLIPREALKALARVNLPFGTGDLTYRAAQERDAGAMRRHRAFLSAVWSRFDPEGDVRLVLTANTSYWAEVELGAALEELGVPFVALHKENLKSPGHAARWAPSYRTERAPFLGRAVLVQNASEATLQSEAGVAPAERITVVGMARLDRFHEHRTRTAGTTVDGDVLFASFLPGLNLPSPPEPRGRDAILGLPLPDPEPRPEHLIEACFALHRVAVQVARLLPGQRVVVKTKGRDQDRRWTRQIIEHTAGPDGVPPNLVLVHGGDAVTMTLAASVVVGLNSTMLLEAIAAGRRAVVLELGEMRAAAREFLIELSGAATIVRDEETAPTTIASLVKHPSVVPATLGEMEREVLQCWAGNSDGSARKRTVTQLRAIMDGG